jgi:pimeloyl-ACP methyl ester carboxylesterase
MALQVQPQDKTVMANGLKLHYLDWGAPDNPPLVLLHGLRGHAHAWDDFSAAVCEDYNVLALDQRGRGDSEWAKDGVYTTEAYVADLLGFSAALHLDSFILIGHSMGGRNGMAFSARYPHKVQKLLVVDIGPGGSTPGSARIRQEISTVPEEFESFEAVVAYMSKQNRYAAPEVLRRRLQYATKPLPNGKIGWRYDLAIREQWRRGPSTPEDLWPAWRSLSCPTLIVRGADSDILSPEAAQQMLAAQPQAREVEIPRAAHMVFEDNPDAFLPAVRAFLRRHEP